jgi:hypothetical protein
MSTDDAYLRQFLAMLASGALSLPPDARAGFACVAHTDACPARRGGRCGCNMALEVWALMPASPPDRGDAA